MSRALRDLTGQKFGSLTVLRLDSRGDKSRHAKWVTLCDCGIQRVVLGCHLVSGHSKSCKGCRRGAPPEQHGLGQLPEYSVWAGMVARCYDPNHKAYARYHGRGITVCDKWRKSFEAFYADLGPRPSSDHSIERDDNDRGYSKANCRWATRFEQNRNKRTNRWLTFQGETLIVTDMARRYGLRPSALLRRLERGWSVEAAITQPVQVRRRPAQRPVTPPPPRIRLRTIAPPPRIRLRAFSQNAQVNHV